MKKIQFTVIMFIIILPVFTEMNLVQANTQDPFFYVSILAPNTSYNPWITEIIEQIAKIGIAVDVFDYTRWYEISSRTWGHPGPYPIGTYEEDGFDILFIGWGWGLDIDFTDLFNTSYWPPNGDNFYQYSRPEMDWALGNFSESYVLSDRIQYAHDIQVLLYEDVPTATIFYPIHLYPMNSNFDQKSWNSLLWDNSYQDMTNWSIPDQTKFHYAVPANFEDFHVFKYESVYDAQWLNQIYGGLVERTPEAPYNNDFGPYGAIACNSSDGLTYDIQINPNLIFADGTKCNASDVEYSYNLLINPNFGHPDYGFYSQYITNESVVINSEFDLTITFNESYSFQNSNLAIDILPKHIWESIAPADQENQAVIWATNDTLDSKLMGIGPYYLFDYDHINDIIHLKRNEYFSNWSGVTPNFDDIFFESYYNVQSVLSALAAGEVDMADAHYQTRLSEIPVGVKYELVDDLISQEMAFNNMHPIIGTGELCPISSLESGKHVRKAISHIIPRENIIEEDLWGLGTPGVTPYPRGAVGFDDTLEALEYNVSLALAHMKLAGYDTDCLSVGCSAKIGLGLKTILSILALTGGSILIINKLKKKKEEV
ncbi:MAG: hypothetical protein GPJ52_06510 [Candidatus Heimdallarchaeota archaeon]|nr:hypothetical protein [Candidatus Heimdallarchaeota archaeon]